MKSTRVAGVAYAAAFATSFACSSDPTIVAVNVLSSNDTQYNSNTLNGSRGGLLDPGIPAGLLDPDAANPNELRQATAIRITITQASRSITREVTPAKNTFDVDVVDENGMKVLDAMGNPTKAKHSGIAQFYTRIELDDAWEGGATEVNADALDASGATILSAVKATIDLQDDEATAAFVDFQLPSPPPPDDGGGAGAGGMDGQGGAGPGTGGAGNDGGATSGTGGTSGGGTDAGGAGGAG